MLTGSTNRRTPFDSKTWSPAPPPSSIIRPYWKPEQPPPCTNTRRPLPVLPSSDSSSLIFEAAEGETLMSVEVWVSVIMEKLYYNRNRLRILDLPVLLS